MVSRKADGSAGDADYGVIGEHYTRYRQPDPRIAARILDALGDAQSVLNVGAGTGSYEPIDRAITAVEPSASMRANRPATLKPAIDAVAENLPFMDGEFDAAMTTLSVHQWSDLAVGLSELRRVTRGSIVILTCDPQALDKFWLNDYAPEVITTEARRFPAIDTIASLLGGTVRLDDVPIPLDCVDGFNEAYYGRPERLLDAGARSANSAWSFIESAVSDGYVAKLGADLDSGEWDRLNRELRTLPEFHGSLRLIVASP